MLYPVRKRGVDGGGELLTPPANPVVTATNLRIFAKVTTEQASDENLERLINTATTLIEQTYGIAFINQTWGYWLNHIPHVNDPWWDGVMEGAVSDLLNSGTPAKITLPIYPLSSVDSVKVYDLNDAETDLPVSEYFHVDSKVKPGYILLRSNKTMPINLRPVNGIFIAYVAGFGPTLSDIPTPYTFAVLALANTLYNKRGDECSPEELLKIAGVKEMLKGLIRVRI